MITKFKIFENNLENIKIDVLTSDEFRDLYFEIYPNQVNLNDLIRYFSWDSADPYSGGEKHRKTLRLITAYNDNEILGICLFAWWMSSETYSISFLSTNKNYFKQGISKLLLEEMFKYFSKEYPDETLCFSGYSIEGWTYLHKKILELSKKYNVSIKEKPIEYVEDWTDENRKLYNKSKEEIKKIYGVDEAKSRGKDIIYKFRTKAISLPNHEYNDLSEYDVFILDDYNKRMNASGYRYVLSIEGTPGSWYVKTLLEGGTRFSNRISIQGDDWFCDNWQEVMDELLEVLPNLDAMADANKYNL